MDQGFRAGGLAVPSDFSSAAMQRFGIRVAEFELDMLAVRLDRFAANAKFFRDLTAAVPSRDEREYRHLAIAEDIETVLNATMASKFMHGKRRNHRADINFTR